MAQQSRQNRQGYNISNKVINKEDKVSKDTYTAKAVKGSFGNRCVRVWNEFPFTMNHKADTIIKQVDQYMTELMEGTFYKNKSIDTEYFKRSNVKMNGRKYTKTELLQGLNNLALFFKEGYPKIKTRELPNLIYNPRTGTSIFLSVIDSPPKPLKDERAITDPNPKLTRLFPFSTPSDKAKLIDGIKTLVKYQKNINVRTQQMEHLFGTPLLLCKTYKEWMEGEDWIEKIEVGYVKSTGKMFKKFVDDMEDECHGYKLVTKLNPTM